MGSMLVPTSGVVIDVGPARFLEDAYPDGHFFNTSLRSSIDFAVIMEGELALNLDQAGGWQPPFERLVLTIAPADFWSIHPHFMPVAEGTRYLAGGCVANKLEHRTWEPERRQLVERAIVGNLVLSALELLRASGRLSPLVEVCQAWRDVGQDFLPTGVYFD